MPSHLDAAAGTVRVKECYSNCDLCDPGFPVLHLRRWVLLLTNGLAREGKKLAFFGSQIALQEKAYLLEELFIRHRKHSSFVRRGAGCWALARTANKSAQILPHFGGDRVEIFLCGYPTYRESEAGNRHSSSPTFLASGRPRHRPDCPAYELPILPSVTEAGIVGFRTVGFRFRIQSSKRLARRGPEFCMLYCG